MTLSDRERFVYHTATLFTLELMRKHKSNLTKEGMGSLIELIKKNRCRKLKSNDFKELFDDIEEEILLSSAVYEMSEQMSKDRKR
jgi:hypothetical protein|tara:strand:- start:67 stop:321 length:255 start_codon:yes stop_codon:yes gene_type:complete